MQMTSKERLLAAMRRDDVDRVPVVQDFWTAGPPEQQFSWDDEADRIAWQKRFGFDPCVYVPAPFEGHGEAAHDPSIEQEVWIESDPNEPYPILCSEWSSPAGTLTSKIRKSDDYPFDSPPFFHDFNTPRYVKPLFANGDDMLTFIRMDPYRIGWADPPQAWRDECATVRALAEREQIAVGCHGGTALDYLIWAATADQAIMLALDYPEEAAALIEYFNAFSDRRVELCLEMGADFVLRRGWYESADFWGPGQFAQFAAPFIAREADLAHASGALSVYLMCTGVEPMLPELAKLDFDCLQKTEPVATGQDLSKIVAALADRKSFWTGLSAPLHIGRGSTEDVRRAVRDAFDIFGRRGFILMAVPSIRKHWPWKENLEAMVDEYRKLEGISE